MAVGSLISAKQLLQYRNQNELSCASCAHGIRASMHIIACIEDPAVISKILNHLAEKSPMDSGELIPNPRTPPQASLFS